MNEQIKKEDEIYCPECGRPYRTIARTFKLKVLIKY